MNSEPIVIKRWYHDDCTIGRLFYLEWQCFTLELPWMCNKQDISCIKEGTYEYFIRTDSKNGIVIELRDVEGRTNIQAHSGNYTRQILGCILVGNSVKWLDSDGIPDVTNSKDTLRDLLGMLEFDTGLIRIES